MVRVLLDFRVREGGAGRYGRELVAALAQTGSEVDLAVFTPQPAIRSVLTAPFTPWARSTVRRRARAWRPDLVHGLHMEASAPAGTPTVVTVQDLIPLDHPATVPSALRRRVLSRTVRASVAGAARVVVPSPASAQALARHGFDTAKVEVVPHGVAPVFRPTSAEERASARQRFAGGRRYVASIWHGRPHKNLGVLAAAMALLPAGHDVVWTAVGAPATVGPITPVPALSDEDLRLFYGGAELLALPSLVEGFGFPLVEALACRTPVVCGPGVGALAYAARGAIQVDVADPQALAQAIRLLVDDDELRERLAAAGAAAVGELTVERMARRTLAVYQAALDDECGGTSRRRSPGRRHNWPAP